MRRQSPVEMRTGLWPEPEPESVERKFNPWHDPEDGRFTFSAQGRYFGRGGSRDNASALAARPKKTPPARPARPTPSAARAQTERIAREGRQREVREGRERDAFKKLMQDAEGDEDLIYLDTEGHPTVGIGHKLPDSYRSRIGERITAAQKEAFLRADADRAPKATREQLREANITDRSFFLPLASVNFQSGTGWFNLHKKTWALIKARRYAAAAREAQDSLWYDQTPKRVRAFQNALLRLEQAERARTAPARSRGASR